MAQLFSRTTSFLFNAAVFAACALPLLLVAIGWTAYGSSWMSGRHEPKAQPVAFSHQHHAGILGIDCR